MRPLGALAALIVLTAGSPPTAGAAAEAPLGQPTALVRVGPGVDETSQRQVIRTRAGVVYIASVDDHGYDGAPDAELHLYRATAAGIPTAFQVADPAHEPAVSAPLDLSGGDARIDAKGTIHVTYAVANLSGSATGEYPSWSVTVKYRTFDTGAGAWGAPETVATLPFDGDGVRGKVISALGLMPTGAPLVVIASSSGVTAWTRATGDSWSRTSVAADAAVHPSIAIDGEGRAHVAWLASPYDESAASIHYAERSATGDWSKPEVVAGQNVLSNATMDQAPSVAFDARARPVVAWLDTNDDVRVAERDGAARWVRADPPPTFAHSPAIYQRGDDRLVFLGHDSDTHPAYLSLAAGSTVWSSVGVFPPPADQFDSYAYDGGASPRFDPLFDADCRMVDVAFFAEYSREAGRVGLPDLYYGAVRLPEPAGGCPPAIGLDGAGDSGGPTPPPPDPTPPPDTTPPPPDPTPPPPDPGPPTVLLGSDAVQAQRDSDDAGMAEAFQATAASDGTITALSIYVDDVSSAAAVIAGLYADDGGHPGALLAHGKAPAKAGQWNVVALPATKVAAGQRYWIALLGVGGERLAFRDADGECRSETTPWSLSLDALPARWTTGLEFDDCPVSAYATGS